MRCAERASEIKPAAGESREDVLHQAYSPTAAGVSVTAPARLHLGFVDLNGGLGRRFGSLGIALAAPSTRVVARRHDGLAADGPEADRVLAHLRRLAGRFDLGGSVRVTVEQAIPAHAGLGSGTQLALAVGAA